MARTPLFAVLRDAVAIAAASRRAGAPPIDELADPARLGRRRFLAGAGAALLAPSLPAQARLAGRGVRIAVVGGGLAGLVAAHRLVADARAEHVTVYEANRRLGGRMLSGPGLVNQGTVVELGGSFINTKHQAILDLVAEFGLMLQDGQREPPPRLRATYFIGGEHRSIADIAGAAATVLPRIEAMRGGPPAEQAAIDRRSAAEVMDGLGIDGWLRRLLDIGLTEEMGLEPDRMSGLYFTDTFAPDRDRPEAGLFSSDQRYQIEGGNDRLPAAIAARLGTRIRTSHRLLALRSQGSAYRLAFDHHGATREVTADIVILAIPMTMLRQVELDIGAPPATRRAIRELTYGTNAKLFAGLTQRPWRGQGLSGECLNDLGVQTVWEDHASPGTGAGAMTIFAGGRTGVEFGRGTPLNRARDALRDVDPALPGARHAFNGRASRMHWPSNPYVHGSYSCFAPGQITAFANAFEPVGRVIFAGEHTAEHSGYMDGAAQSGVAAASAAAGIAARV